MMEALLEKERELQRLNAELDEKQRKMAAAATSPSPRKKVPGMPRGKTPKPRGSSRPPSRTREAEKEDGDGEKFVWAPIKGQEGGSNNYIWAPISQEELFLEAREKKKEKEGKKSGQNSAAAKKVVKSASVEHLPVGGGGEGVEEQEVKFVNDEEEMRAYTGNSRVDATQQRMLNIKIRGLETTLDKVTFEKSEMSQEKEQTEKELKIAEDQRRRLEASNRGMQGQLEKARGELVEVRHHLGKSEEECTLLRREAENATRDAKKNLSKKSSADVRLNRALEDAAKLKGELLAAERERKEAKEGGKKTIDELTLKTKFLEKQRNELLHGFKKQMELIDVLKRQKLHLEAAHVLKYTEEEFMQTLDWKPNNVNNNSQSSSGVSCGSISSATSTVDN